MKKKLLAVPICALVLVGGFMITAKAKQSNAAADVFTQNELSAEGLSREDLKTVCRDITTNRFTNDKTAEVIKRSVPGVEILQKVPAPGESADWRNGFA